MRGRLVAGRQLGGRRSGSTAFAPRLAVGADALANTRSAAPGTVLAFRFRPGWTGRVRAVRFYVVVNSDGRNGYSGGNPACSASPS